MEVENDNIMNHNHKNEGFQLSWKKKLLSYVIAKLKRKQNRDFGNHKDKLNSLVF